MAKHTIEDLYQMQSLPLSAKIRMTENRIRGWVDEYGVDGVYVSFSGGKDSTVLLDIVRKLYPSVKAVFVDTGLEYPEIRDFVKTFDNVEWLKPKMNFRQVIEKYGYPFISKEISNVVQGGKVVGSVRWKRLKGTLKAADGIGKSQFNCEKWGFMLDAPFNISDSCCQVMKKNPAKEYYKQTKKVPILAQLAEESYKRRRGWLKTGCNAFDLPIPQSNPMAFWKEQDVLLYIKENDLPIASVYGDIVYKDDDGMCYSEQIFSEAMKLTTTGCSRTGCMFCGYGAHCKDDNRFEQMKETHPKQYDYIMRPTEQGGLGYKEIIDWINEHGNVNIKY